jgi:hypothetical protein
LKGIELNPEDNPEPTADSVARDLGLPLANEPKNISSHIFNNSDDRRAYETEQARKAKQAAERKRSWNTHSSNIDERYHNAAVSLVFVLKNGVYVEGEDRLDDIRALALKEFLEVLDWATPPQAWHIRTGLIRDLLNNLPLVVSGSRNLVDIVDRHIGVCTGDGLWGGLNVSIQQCDTPQSFEVLLRNNTKWTESCSRSERTLGFTWGLWNLFHITTIGSSHSDHQLVSPQGTISL